MNRATAEYQIQFFFFFQYLSKYVSMHCYWLQSSKHCFSHNLTANYTLTTKPNIPVLKTVAIKTFEVMFVLVSISRTNNLCGRM